MTTMTTKKTAAATAPENRFVILRSNMSGVWFGRLAESTSQSRVLTEARRCYGWEGALSCSELALAGPTGGLICAAVSRVEVDRAPGDEMLDASEAAVAAFATAPAAK